MSYASTQFIAPDMTSDATFRVWSKAVSDALASMGMVRSSDTGQVPAWTSRTFADAAITTGTAILTSPAGATFTPADVGMQINVTGAGVAGAVLQTTITVYTSATQVTVANNAGTTVTASSATIGQRKPSAGSTASGYEIWKFNDTLQATLPVFFKLEYGSGNISTDPGLWLTVGTSSNGSGTITGQAMTRRAILSNSIGTATTKTCVFSGDTNRAAVFLFTNAASNIGFGIERTKDGAGADTSAGILVCSFLISSTFEQQFIPATGAVPAALTTGQVLCPTGASSGADGLNLNMYPIFHVKNGSFLNPGLNFVTYFNADVTVDSTGSIPMYGANHTMYFIGQQARAGLSQSGSSNLRVAMRYE